VDSCAVSGIDWPGKIVETEVSVSTGDALTCCALTGRALKSKSNEAKRRRRESNMNEPRQNLQRWTSGSEKPPQRTDIPERRVQAYF